MKRRFFIYSYVRLYLISFLCIFVSIEGIKADTKIAGTSYVEVTDWSTNGILFYTTKGNDSSDISMIYSDGTNEKQLTSEQGFELNGIYSSDGSKIYYPLFHGKDISIWRMNSDGTDKEKIFQLPSGYFLESIIVSPDNSKCAFISYELATERCFVWIVNTDGTGDIKLTNAEVYKFYSKIDFSADSEWIVFVSTSGEICKIKTDNTERT